MLEVMLFSAIRLFWEELQWTLNINEIFKFVAKNNAAMKKKIQTPIP